MGAISVFPSYILTGIVGIVFSLGLGIWLLTSTDKKYGRIEIEIPKELYEEIKLSIKINPRKYLFVSSGNNKPYKEGKTFNSWANKTLKKVLGKKNFTLSMFRHIYISRRDLKLEEKSGLEQDKLAKIMGHNINDQQKKYSWHTWLEEQ